LRGTELPDVFDDADDLPKLMLANVSLNDSLFDALRVIVTSRAVFKG
jgi:hypothetical protein